MTSPGTVQPREDGRDRRREVKRRLAESGFRRGPSRLRAAPDPAAPVAPVEEDERFVDRLAALLLRLGGLFPVFGFYLSSRADLLAADECGELARLPAAAAPAFPAAVEALLAAELGRSPADVFAELDPAPCRSRLAVQAHRARLRTGEPAVVELVHPDLAGWLATDLELLPLLAGAFAARPGFPLLEAIADFEVELARETDLAATAAAMEALAADLGSLRGAAGGLAPRVFRALTRGRVLAYERPDGRTLVELPSSPDRLDELRPLARRLCAAWLGQVLLGHTFPVTPRPEAVVAMAGGWGGWIGGRIAFTGGPYETPSAALQAGLSRYLAAAARDDPDEVSAALLPELTRKAAREPGEPGETRRSGSGCARPCRCATAARPAPGTSPSSSCSTGESRARRAIGRARRSSPSTAGSSPWPSPRGGWTRRATLCAPASSRSACSPASSSSAPC